MKRVSKVLLVLLFATLCCGTLFASAINGFDPASNVSVGTTVVFSGSSGTGSTAAEYWSAWLNAAGNVNTTVSQLPPVDGGQYMIDVNTSGAANGIYQNHLSYTGNISVWVLPISGVVDFGAESGYNSVGLSTSATTGNWQQLTLSPTLSPGNDVTEIYFESVGGTANFYLTDINMTTSLPSLPSAVPEPSVAFLILPAFMGLVGLRRKLTK